MTLPKIAEGSFWLPHQGSTLAPEVDHAWDAAMAFSLVAFVGVVVGIAYVVMKYRGSGADRRQVTGNRTLGLLWTGAATLVVLGLFVVGLGGFVDASVAPGNSYEIQVTGQNGSWKFTYPNGTESPNKLVVPKGRPIKLVMTSKDATRSFAIPEFRIQRDVVPGTETTLWFEAPSEQQTIVACTEHCGGSSETPASVEVTSAEKFDDFLGGGDDSKTPPEELGKKLFAKNGCAACHSLDGSKGTGPTLKDLYGHDVALTTGATVKADDAYIHESIVNSQAKIVAGYMPIMPVFQGVLKDKQVDALVAFIKAQSTAGGGDAQPTTKP